MNDTPLPHEPATTGDDGAGAAADADPGREPSAPEAQDDAPSGPAHGPEVVAGPGHDRDDVVTPPLPALLEAVLLVADHPVPAVVLAQVVEQPTEAVEAELTAMSHRWSAQERGIDLRQVAGGWRLYSREECAPWVERFVLDGQQARLSQAALETLAVVAYRQPVTRARVSAVRGVNVDGVIRTLSSRGLLAEAGQDADTGGTLYVTTPLLLEKLGLQSIEELPSLAPLLPELDEFDQDSMST